MVAIRIGPRLSRRRKLRNEYVITVSGRAPAPRRNGERRLVSGEIEVLAHEIEILNTLTPPFQIDDENISRRSGSSIG